MKLMKCLQNKSASASEPKLGAWCAFGLCILMFLSCIGMMDIRCLAKEQDGLELYATAAALMDAESGRVLYGKNEQEPMPNASTTKIMTCILVLEECDLQETVAVSHYASTMPKVHCGLRKGETYKVEDLLYSLMLESHNDSAVALAEHVGKRGITELEEKSASDFTEEESKLALKSFANRMNEKAKQLGCKDTYFITPNGLDGTETLKMPDGEVLEMEHHTTASDLARIMSYCVLHSPRKEAFLCITQRDSHAFFANGRQFLCQNHNAFLHMMDGVLSGKTGFTGKAGYCYVGALQRGDRVFVVALLACGWPDHRAYKWQDSKKMLEYGCEAYHRKTLEDLDVSMLENKLPQIEVQMGQGTGIEEKTFVSCEIRESKDPLRHGGVLLGKGERIDIRITVVPFLVAPVNEGEKVGEIIYGIGEEELFREDIVAKETVERIDWAWCLHMVWESFLDGKSLRFP